MSDIIIEDTTFTKQDFAKLGLNKGEYNYCNFIDCNLSNLKLSDYKFIDCSFNNCDLSNAKLANTAMQSIKFDNCKMFGLIFSDCNEFLFSASFTKCRLNFSSFYKTKIKNTLFNDCNLTEVDFVQTDLSNSKFKNCDFSKSIFDNTNLEKSDLTSSYNYSINPNMNRLKKAKFSKEGIIGLLDNLDIIIK